MFIMGQALFWGLDIQHWETSAWKPVRSITNLSAIGLFDVFNVNISYLIVCGGVYVKIQLRMEYST